MADLSAAVDPGSRHLLGHVLGDGQAIPMAPDHVGASSVCVEAFDHLVSEPTDAEQRPASLAPCSL